MVQDFEGRVRFAIENFGDSALARRFGVTRYPAIFVDDILVATPKDFGFFGKGEGPDVARYAPFQSAEGHAHFRADIGRAIRLVLDGKKAEVVASSPEARAIPRLPAIELTDLDGKPIPSTSLAGRPVLVEFWATWCPPCCSTLAWLAQLHAKEGDRLMIVALAVDSDPEVVRKLASDHPGIRFGLATPAIGRAFGDVSALPTLFVFGKDGSTVRTFLGAPPSLHAEVEAALGVAGR